MDALLAKLEGDQQGVRSPVGLDLAKADGFLEQRMRELKAYLDSMRHVLASGYLARDNVLLAAREMLAAIGEAHSAFNAVEILKGKGHRTFFMDLTGFDDDETWTIDERIHRKFQDVDPAKQIVVVTGYTKGSEGIMREFDRGYSEVTFSKVAVELDADEAIIHKEFHLSSADPEIVGAGNTVPVGQTNYDVADQLADVGMEAIHPKAAKPIEMAGIAIRLKNTFEPDHPGTLITKSYVGKQARVEVIAGTQKVTIVDIHDPRDGRRDRVRPRHPRDLQEARRLVHPEVHQRELDHPRHPGQGGEAGVHRRAEGPLRAGDHRCPPRWSASSARTSPSRASSPARPTSSPRTRST